MPCSESPRNFMKEQSLRCSANSDTESALPFKAFTDAATRRRASYNHINKKSDLRIKVRQNIIVTTSLSNVSMKTKYVLLCFLKDRLFLNWHVANHLSRLLRCNLWLQDSHKAFAARAPKSISLANQRFDNDLKTNHFSLVSFFHCSIIFFLTIILGILLVLIISGSTCKDFLP